MLLRQDTETGRGADHVLSVSKAPLGTRGALNVHTIHKNKGKKKEADEQNYQIKVIVYLRRQDKFLLSRWNQSVKQRTSHVSEMPCDQYFKMTQEKNEKIYQYDKKLDEIAKVIGKENLIVRRL